MASSVNASRKSNEPSALLLHVVIFRGHDVVSADALMPGVYTLGSSPHADLQLPDNAVAGQQGVLFVKNGRAVLQDSGAGPGLTVNGGRVKTAEVSPRDEIKCGPFLIRTWLSRAKSERTMSQLPTRVETLLNKPPPLARSLSPSMGSLPPGVADADPALALTEAIDDAPMEPTKGRAAAELPGARLASEVGPDVDPAIHHSETARFVPPGRPSLTTVPAPAAKASSELTISSPNRQTAGRKPTGNTPAVSSSQLEAAKRTSKPLLPVATTRNLPKVARPASTRNMPRVTPTPVRAARAAGARPLPIKGPKHLRLDLYWGYALQQTRCFADVSKGVQAEHRHGSDMPLWGFSFPGGSHALVEEGPKGSFRLHVPPKATIEVEGPGGFQPAGQNEVGTDKKGRFIDVSAGRLIRLCEGQMRLVASVAEAPPPPPSQPLQSIPKLPVAVGAIVSVLFGLFVATAPSRDELAEVAAHKPIAADVKLLLPEPPKPPPEPPKPPEEEKAEKVEDAPPEPKEKPQRKKEKVLVRKEKNAPTNAAPAPSPQDKVLKALDKMAAAGPAMKDMLAAVDKLGNGPGSKNATDYKLSGLIGKAPIANAGLGNFGLGGGGRGGMGTLGAELLRGKGGGGIGAMGAGGFGRSGRVGGTVARAAPRTIGVQGTIDKEAVARVVNAHLQEIRACYERSLLKNPGLAGKVVLEWGINTSGGVTTARTKASSLQNAAVESCMLSSLKTWRFPAARGGQVMITYPFMFNSVGY